MDLNNELAKQNDKASGPLLRSPDPGCFVIIITGIFYTGLTNPALAGNDIMSILNACDATLALYWGSFAWPPPASSWR